LHCLATARSEKCAGSSEEGEYGRAEMSEKAGEEERTRRMCHVLGRETLICHEVPGMIQRHQNHDKPAQDIYGNQTWSVDGKNRGLRGERSNCRRRGGYHLSAVQSSVAMAFINSW